MGHTTPLIRIEGLTLDDRKTLMAQGIDTLEAFWQRQANDHQLINNLRLPDDLARTRVKEAILQATQSRLASIQGLDPVDRRILATKGVSSIEDFSQCMAANPKFIVDLDLLDDTAKARVTQSMAEAVKNHAKSVTENPLHDHIPDILVLIVVCFLLYGAFRQFTAKPATAEMSPQVVIVKPNGLTPYQVISPSDVAIRDTPKAPGAVTSVNEVIGRYARQYLAVGAVVDESNLNKHATNPDELAGRQIFNVNLKPSSIMRGLPLPAKISLMVSPRDGVAAGILINNVYLLDVRIKGDVIVALVAITAVDSEALVPLLARSDLIVVGPAHY